MVPGERRSTIDAAMRRRGLVPGDAPACDRLRRALLAQARATPPEVDQVRACYAAVTLDRAFINAKLARVTRRIAQAGRESDPAVQRLSKQILDLTVAGRHKEANRALGQLEGLLRR